MDLANRTRASVTLGEMGMTGLDKERGDHIVEQAAGWIARLQSSDATDADRRDFEAWLGQSPTHGEAYNDLKSLWSELRDVPLAAVSKRPKDRARSPISRPILSLCALAGLFFVLQHGGFIDRLRADYSTSVGEIRRVTLDDGTVVTLNTDSAIAVDYKSETRKISLLRGEAFFDVARNPNRPFVVSGDRMNAEVLGTHFSMETASTGFAPEVEVEEGRVAVTSSEDQMILQGGDAATWQAGRLTMSHANVAEATAWRDGKLIFSGQPLGRVLKTLERYRSGRIFVLDDRVSGYLVSGVFDLHNTDEALDVIESNLPVSMTRLAGMVIVRSKG